MSSIAEFYSRSLATEVVKGTQQKVSAGGTPHIAPIGYLNVRRIVDGVESRTIAVDTEREELVRWAFGAYATGSFSIRQLARELEDKGLTQRPTATRPARPVAANELHALLRNRYYLGYVTWRRVEYQGKHPALVDAETFEGVQAVLEAHRLSGERSYRHPHYLAGTLFCGRCSSRLLYGTGRGRHGETYEYFFCAGRHSGRTGCELPYLPLDQVEAALQKRWDAETFTPSFAAALRDDLAATLKSFNADRQVKRERLTHRSATIRRERYKWAEKAMEGAVPNDIAREKQQSLADQLLTVEAALERFERSGEAQVASLDALMTLVGRCGDAYRRSDEKGRRDY